MQVVMYTMREDSSCLSVFFFIYFYQDHKKVSILEETSWSKKRRCYFFPILKLEREIKLYQRQTGDYSFFLSIFFLHVVFYECHMSPRNKKGRQRDKATEIKKTKRLRVNKKFEDAAEKIVAYLLFSVLLGFNLKKKSSQYHVRKAL